MEEEMGLAGAAAEDAEAECIRHVTEKQIVTGRVCFCALLQLHEHNGDIIKFFGLSVILSMHLSQFGWFSVPVQLITCKDSLHSYL